MKKADVDKYRGNVASRLEELTVMNAEQNSNINNIKEAVIEIKDLVKEQNARVRKNESAISKMQGVFGIVSVIFGSIIGWLFKGRL